MLQNKEKQDLYHPRELKGIRGKERELKKTLVGTRSERLKTRLHEECWKKDLKVKRVRKNGQTT